MHYPIPNTLIKLLGVALIGVALPASAATSTSISAAVQPESIPQRHLPLEGVYNLRDLGGYRTEDGRSVRWGVLFRSSDISDITTKDQEQIKTLGIKTICDFRSDRERAQRPDTQLSPWQFDSRCNSLDQNTQELSKNVSGTVDWRGRFIGFYSGMGKAYAPQYRALFDDLKQNKTPLLFHCTAGKDRTGVGAALVLLALGVPKDTVLNDYHLTEEYINAAPPTAMARLPELSLAPAAVKAADPDYLNAALAGIDRDYGSLNNYFEMALGVSAADREQLRARYVDPESTTPARSQYK